MQENTKSSGNMFIVIGVIIAIGVAGYLYISRDQSSDELLVSTLPGQQATSVDAELLSALGRLKNIQLNDNIFKSPLWLSLVDSGKTLVPQDSGRVNPFAPLEASSQGTTTSVNATP